MPLPIPLPEVPSQLAPSHLIQIAEVARQIAELTEVVGRLVHARHERHAPPAPAAQPPADIGGDLPGGASLVPAIDYAKLSPLQQITLGLRDAKPVGPGKAAVLHASAKPDHEPQGAD